MADLPILFSGTMVRAQLEDRKTNTRRVLTRLRRFGNVREFGRSDTPGYDWHFRDKEGRWHDLRHSDLLKVLPYAVGDRLYVREAHHRTNDSTDSHLVGYDFADDPNHRKSYSREIAGVGKVEFFRHSLGGWGGRTSRNYPAMHMPRWASRLTNIVTDVRVQRLQEISEEDALAEGVFTFAGERPMMANNRKSDRDLFRELWDGINAARSFGWEANPWVVAVSFRVEKANIDQVAA